MRWPMTAALALLLGLGACEQPTGPQPRMGGLPGDFPPTILTDMSGSDRAGVEEIIALYSSGLVGHCTEEQIAVALAIPTIVTWFGYAETRSPESIAYVERTQAELAEGNAHLPEDCRRRVVELAHQIPD